MTNDSNRHAQKLADTAWRIQRRASLYHALLSEVQRGMFTNTVEYIDGGERWTCNICLRVSSDFQTITHADSCLITRIHRALAADDVTVAALLAGIAGEDA